VGRSQIYEDRVNRVLDYIGQHLEGDLSLARLARVGAFSAFHFHRIFQAVTGETLNSHVRRVRLERAASLMKASPRKRITDVALETGFAGTAEFSRAFKNHFGRPPSAWDRRSALDKSKMSKAEDGPGLYSVEDLRCWKDAKGIQVRVEQRGPFRYVYRRIYPAYGSARLIEAYHALRDWVGERKASFIGMSMDDPSITPAEKCRYDLGVAFSDSAAMPGRPECEALGFSIREFEALQIAAMHCEGDLGDVGRAWQYLYRVWLPEGKFEPADLPAMEIFVRLPEEIGWEKFDLKACIPVVRL
jgi:AraC family transcriptional regulator